MAKVTQLIGKNKNAVLSSKRSLSKVSGGTGSNLDLEEQGQTLICDYINRYFYFESRLRAQSLTKITDAAADGRIVETKKQLMLLRVNRTVPHNK